MELTAVETMCHNFIILELSANKKTNQICLSGIHAIKNLAVKKTCDRVFCFAL